MSIAKIVWTKIDEAPKATLLTLFHLVPNLVKPAFQPKGKAGGLNWLVT